MKNKLNKIKIYFSYKEKLHGEINALYFTTKSEFIYKPGQYIQIVLKNTDVYEEGNSRFFTIASAPTENTIMITTKISNNGSIYKKVLNNLEPGAVLYCYGPLGNFTLE